MMARDDWTRGFAPFRHAPEAVRSRLADAGQVIAIAPGNRIFGPGQAPDNFLLVLAGTVRVQQVAENGREIVLYRVTAGESCALTTACLMAYEEYQAEAITETDVQAVAIPRGVFDDLLATSHDFRKFVFTSFSQRVTALFRVVEEVVFARLDVRLAQRLIALADGHGRIAATHQQLANELGSAREVISRLLGEFHRRGWIETSRGTIEIADHAGLSKLAAHG